MRTFRRYNWLLAVPLIMGLLLAPMGAMATFTTGTHKTIGGGFTGGTITGDATFTGTNLFTGRTTFGSAVNAANAIDFGVTAGGITFEGSVADGNEMTLVAGNPGADITVTIPAAASGTLATQELAETLSSKTLVAPLLSTSSSGHTLGALGNVSTNGGFGGRADLTPDAPVLFTGSNSNSMHFEEVGDAGFDFNNGPCGTAACIDPNLIVHSAVQDTPQYTALAAGVISSKAVKTLTESSATSIFNIPITTLTGTGGEFNYCVLAADASNVQHRCGRIKWNAINVADTETCNMTAVAGTTDASIAETEDGSGSGAISTGTLTYAVTCAGATNSVTFSINAVSSLTQTTLQAEYSVLMTGRGQVARQ